MKELSLFTGLGGGIYGSIILGWQTVAYVEKNKYCRKVIAQRINEGWFDKGEIYDDLAEFNKKNAYKYRELIDILTGGFPCQPHSVCGKREGTSDTRYLGDEIEETISINDQQRCFLRMSEEYSPIQQSLFFAKCSPVLDTSLASHYCLAVKIVEASLSAKDYGFTLPTPRSSRAMCANLSLQSVKNNKHRNLETVISNLLPEQTSCYDHRPTLNPSFLEWMMNYPIGASRLKLSAMDKTQS